MAKDRIILGDASWQLGLFLLTLGCFFFLGVGTGLCIKWVGAAKFFGPIGILGLGPYLRIWIRPRRNR